MAHKYGQGLIL